MKYPENFNISNSECGCHTPCLFGFVLASSEMVITRDLINAKLELNHCMLYLTRSVVNHSAKFEQANRPYGTVLVRI